MELKISRDIIYNDEKYIVEKLPHTLFSPIPCKLRTKSIHERIRWSIQMPYGYEVYTLSEKANGEEVAYCFISRAGNFRYPFAKKGDYILGPYYVKKNNRGERLASKLLRVCLEEYPNVTVWDFIQHDNTASIKVTESLGLQYVTDVKYSKILRILRPCVKEETGDMKLYSNRGRV